MAQQSSAMTNSHGFVPATSGPPHSTLAVAALHGPEDIIIFGNFNDL